MKLDDQSRQLIHAALGKILSPKEWSKFSSQLSGLEPETNTQIWQLSTTSPGLYILINGKVRLIDGQKNLIATLTAGDSWGESTLFPEEQFQDYHIKTTTNPAQLCFIPAHSLQKFLNSDLCVQSTLHQRATQLHHRLISQDPETLYTNDLQSRLPVPLKSTTKPANPSIGKAFFPSPKLRVKHIWQLAVQRYPIFEQQSASDCGAACLVMIGHYWGKRLSINYLRQISNVDRNGASLLGLLNAAESLGFAARPVRATLPQLMRQSLPAIAHWEGNHFIVVYKITPTRVIVGDPAIGQRSLKHSEFQAGWSGFVLLLQPTRQWRQTPEVKQSLWEFVELIRPHRVVIGEIIIASVFIQLLGLVTPLITQFIIDNVLKYGSETTLTAIGIGLLILGLFRVIIGSLRQYLLDHTANKIDLALIFGFIKHTFRLPLHFFETRYVGDIVSRIQENQKIQRFLTGESLSIILDLMTLVVYIGLMFSYSWQMTLLTLTIVPPFALITLISTPFLRRISREIFKASTEESSYLIQALTGVSTVKTMAIEHSVVWQWEDLLSHAVKKRFSGQLIGNSLQTVTAALETVVTTGLLWFGAWQVLKGEMQPGQFIAFNMLVGNVINPFKRLAALWEQLQEVMIAVERIQDVLEASPEEESNTPKLLLPEVKGHLQFEAVTFRYQEEATENILSNLSFSIEPGQMVALVGRSGSGKTTLSKLILGLYPPTDGKIYIDGYDVTTLSLRSLRQQVGVVNQDTFLFGSTIRENISIAYPQAPLSDVVAAAQLAGADEFITRLPMGYETRIGEGGGLLSGGQRQRLAIARALMGDPRILVFDEATSHLDTESERVIQNNLGEIRSERTMIVIAHRLSTIRNADLIVCLNDGYIEEMGNHDELIQMAGCYANLYRNQFSS